MSHIPNLCNSMNNPIGVSAFEITQALPADLRPSLPPSRNSKRSWLWTMTRYLETNEDGSDSIMGLKNTSNCERAAFTIQRTSKEYHQISHRVCGELKLRLFG